VLLLMIGTGATAGAALVNYSGLASATAAEHLLVIHANQPDIELETGGRRINSRPWHQPFAKIKHKDTDDDLLMMLS